jgi:spermidine synthase
MNPQTEKGMSLILIGFLALFLELVFIRWLPSNVMSLAYFSNIVLISSFLGLGLGAAFAPKDRDFFKWFPVVLLVTSAFFILFRNFEVIMPPQASEWIWSYYVGNAIASLPMHLGIYSALAVVYSLVAGLFFLIGQKIASLMSNFQPLRAYGLDLVGSILGISAFGLLSFIGGGFSYPATWFAVAGIATLWFLRKDLPYVLIGVLCLSTTVFIVHRSSIGEIWSPYYNIQIKNNDDGSFNLFVNKFFHQQAVNFATNSKAKDKYSLPYSLIKDPKRVLILGAGTGNDVAVAAMHDVPEINAVEIDPAIVKLGEKHPSHPYQNPNVHVFIDDARSYLKKDNSEYDMIILGTLDSHALLSAMSTVRLDNFVYTVESFKDIKQHLKKDGIAVLMFSVPTQWLGEKLLKSASVAFDNPRPMFYMGDSFLFNLMIVAGPGLEKIMAEKSIDTSFLTQIPDRSYGLSGLPTDDWPYLYLIGRTIPGLYLKIIALLLAISFIGIYTLSPRNRLNRQSINFFCLGAAFLLLETKSVTSLSLLFGSTWLVNLFVFGGILLMLLLANILVSKIDIRRIGAIYILLGSSLLLNFLVPVSHFLGYGFWPAAVLSSMFVALPLFFASVVFSYHFKSVREIGAMYGINLAGAVLGGFLEYSSMITGLNGLYVVAGIFYLSSFFLQRNKDGSTQVRS